MANPSCEARDQVLISCDGLTLKLAYTANRGPRWIGRNVRSKLTTVRCMSELLIALSVRKLQSTRKGRMLGRLLLNDLQKPCGRTHH